MKNARANDPRTKCLGLYYGPFEPRVATRSEILRASDLGISASVRGYRSGFLTSRPPLFHRRLAVALLKSGDGDGQHEFLFAMIVELDHDILFGAGKNRA